MSVEEIWDSEPVVTFDSGVDRRNFLRYAGLVGVGVTFVAGGGIAGASHASASTVKAAVDEASASGDLGIMNYALTLEYLESTFYNMGLDAGLLKGRDLALVSPIKVHEATHVAALTAAIKKAGGTPVAKPTIRFPKGTFGSADKFLSTAATFEELGVKAYHGQVPLIKQIPVLAAAASIAGVESRHAAILASLTNGNPFPATIEKHEPKSFVLGKVKPFVS